MFKLLTVSLLIYVSFSFASQETIRIIIPAAKVQPKRMEVVNIVNGTMLKWSDGSNISLYIEDLNRVDSELFQGIFSIDKDKFLNNWRIKFFSGKASLPKQVKNIEDSLSLLSNAQNSILIILSAEDVSDELLKKKNLKIVKL